MWELSPAHDQWHHECRASVYQTLCNFGAPHDGQWPARASITDIQHPTPHPSAFINYTRCGQQGIHRIIERDAMPNVVAFNARTMDVWFVPVISGNTDGTPPSEWTLDAYVTTHTQLVVIRLGCDHTNRISIKQSGTYQRWNCLDCDYTWGITNGST